MAQSLRYPLDGSKPPRRTYFPPIWRPSSRAASLLYPDVCRGVRRSLLWNDIHATQKPVSVSIARCLPGANRSSCILKAQSRAFSITTSVDVRDDDFRSLDLNLGAISEQDRRDAVLEVGLLRLVARLKALVGLGTYLLTLLLGYLYTLTY